MSPESSTPEDNEQSPKTKVAVRKGIGFRLDDVSSRALAARAAKGRLSAHALSRAYVLAALEADTNQTNIQEALFVLNQEIQQLRSDLILCAEALLIGAGKASPQDAKKWVQKNLTS